MTGRTLCPNCKTEMVFYPDQTYSYCGKCGDKVAVEDVVGAILKEVKDIREASYTIDYSLLYDERDKAIRIMDENVQIIFNGVVKVKKIINTLKENQLRLVKGTDTVS